MSLPENRSSVPRICVWRNRECVPLSAGAPTLSSAYSPWRGALLERLVHGPHTEENHQHLNHFLVLHLDGPSLITWRLAGKTGAKTVVPGQVSVISRGTEDSTSFPLGSKRIVLNLEPCIFKNTLTE